MPTNIDLAIATSSQIEASLCEQLERVRLARNLTQVQLAREAGIATGTLQRLEKGLGVSLDTFIRVLIALELQSNLVGLLPDPTIRPVERVNYGGKERQRSRPGRTVRDKGVWTWGDEKDRKS